MNQPLTIAVAQPPCVPKDVRANAETHAATILAAGADVVVFPELSLTGYEMSAPTVRSDDPELACLVEACKTTGTVALVGALVDGADGRGYIAMLAVNRDAVAVVYRKMWLFEAEHDRFAPGDTPTVITVNRWRLGLAICMDTGVPDHARQTAALGIDAYVASTLFRPARAAGRDKRMSQIALDHGVWVAVASFAGPTGDYPETSGRSGIWSPEGKLVTDAGPHPGAIAVARLPA